MFNNPMNYQLFKSVQEEFENDDKLREGASIIPTLVKITALVSSLAALVIGLAERVLA